MTAFDETVELFTFNWEGSLGVKIYPVPEGSYMNTFLDVDFVALASGLDSLAVLLLATPALLWLAFVFLILLMGLFLLQNINSILIGTILGGGW